MAITETDRLAAIRDLVAREIAQHGVLKEETVAARGILRVELEQDVKRSVQVYWTGFQADVPGASIGLHLEIAEPHVHWGEAYLSPDYRNWVFFFVERPDGEIQLAHYGDYATPTEAIDEFFTQASWYLLTATDTTWSDVLYKVDERLDWADPMSSVSGNTATDAVQESLKKSTIIWLRWNEDGVQRTMPVWYLNDKGGTLYVISGERQQTIPNAAQLRRCDIIFRWKGKNSRVGEIPAAVRVLPKDDDWDAIAERIAEKRLNIPGAPEATARRWRDDCEILELTPLS
ncbi:MAG TPA: hypothetical protein VNC78_08610 [Actinomycetota bacterium]|nr:hypothetical protein [Actinomycetota bacterium]